MIPFLAYKIQENAYGGLKPSTRAELRRIGRALETGSGSLTPDMRPRTKPGTRMVRHWRGKPHEVVVTESGFEKVPADWRGDALRGNDGGWTQQMKNIESYVSSTA